MSRFQITLGYELTVCYFLLPIFCHGVFYADLRDKEVKKGGVGGVQGHRGVAPVQKHKVSVNRHRVRDSRLQVESSL